MCRHQYAIVAVLAGCGLLLQGCGGGGSTPAPSASCENTFKEAGNDKEEKVEVAFKCKGDKQVEITQKTTIDGKTTSETVDEDLPNADGKCDQAALDAFKDDYPKCKSKSMSKVQPAIFAAVASNGFECKNKELELRSQSFSIGGAVNIPGPGQVSVVNMSITAKADMEYMKFYEDVVMYVPFPDPMKPENPNLVMTSVTKVMLDAENKRLAFATDVNLPGLHNSTNCSYMNLPFLMPVRDLRDCVEKAFDQEGLAPPETPGLSVLGPFCVRNGSFDEWRLTMNMEPQKDPEGHDTPKVTANYGFELTDEMLFHSMKYEVEVAGQETIKGTLRSTTAPTEMGPSAGDMDYTTWGFGQCSEVPFPGVPPQAKEFQAVKFAMRLLARARPASATSVLSHSMMAGNGRRLQGGPGAPPMPAMAQCFFPHPGMVTV